MDIWSIGITILELCDKKLPHSHLNPMRAIFAISKSDAPILSNTGRNGKVNTYRTLFRRFFSWYSLGSASLKYFFHKYSNIMLIIGDSYRTDVILIAL